MCRLHNTEYADSGAGAHIVCPCLTDARNGFQLLRDAQKTLLDSARKLEQFINTIKGHNYTATFKFFHCSQPKRFMSQNRTNLDIAGINLFFLWRRCGGCLLEWLR